MLYGYITMHGEENIEFVCIRSVLSFVLHVVLTRRTNERSLITF